MELIDIVFNQLEKYCSELKDAKKNSIVKGELNNIFNKFCKGTFYLFIYQYHVSGTIGQSSMGLMFGLIYCAYGLGFWYGNKLIQDYR